jgi:hypothetical protein
VVEPIVTPAPIENNPGNSRQVEAKSDETTIDGKETKFKISQVLGTAKYKETIARADELFKMKRYEEAKVIYKKLCALNRMMHKQPCVWMPLKKH